MRHILHGIFWIVIYLLLVMAPLFVMLSGQTPPGRGFGRELSVGLGFVGLSMMGWQFILTGRFKHITSPYGIDVVYHFHRIISLIAFVFILLHPTIILISSPGMLAFLNPARSPWWMIAGSGALLGFALVIATSLYRQSLKLNYERWRIIHGYIAVGAVALSLAHTVGGGYYLQSPVKRWLWIMMITAWILSLAYVRILKPFRMLRNPYTVAEVRKERGKSWTLALTPEGHKSLHFEPGQFGWITLDTSPFSIREHPFSFSSSSMERERVEITIKELGDFTSGIGGMSPGSRAYIDGPYGTFTIDRHFPPGYVFIAGGIGITPVISILRTMSDRRDSKPILLFYGSKTWEETTFREELGHLTKQLNLNIIHILEEAPVDWQGERGFLTPEMMARHLPKDRAVFEFFVCGPLPMQKAVKEALKILGLPLDRVQSESFNFV